MVPLPESQLASLPSVCCMFAYSNVDSTLVIICSSRRSSSSGMPGHIQTRARDLPRRFASPCLPSKLASLPRARRTWKQQSDAGPVGGLGLGLRRHHHVVACALFLHTLQLLILPEHVLRANSLVAGKHPSTSTGHSPPPFAWLLSSPPGVSTARSERHLRGQAEARMRRTQHMRRAGSGQRL